MASYYYLLEKSYEILLRSSVYLFVCLREERVRLDLVVLKLRTHVLLSALRPSYAS